MDEHLLDDLAQALGNTLYGFMRQHETALDPLEIDLELRVEWRDGEHVISHEENELFHFNFIPPLPPEETENADFDGLAVDEQTLGDEDSLAVEQSDAPFSDEPLSEDDAPPAFPDDV